MSTNSNERAKSIWKRQFHPAQACWKILRPRIGWQFWRRCLFALVCCATVVALFYAEEDLRGRLAWQRFKRRWEPKNGSLDWSSYVPLKVPDTQNFALTPLLRPLFDYDPAANPPSRDTNGMRRINEISFSPTGKRVPELGDYSKGRKTDLRAWQEFFRQTNASHPLLTKEAAFRRRYGIAATAPAPEPSWPMAREAQSPAADILFALTRFDPALDELRQAVRRPYSQFPIHYAEAYMAWLPHLTPLSRVSKILALRAIAELNLGQQKQALGDVELIFSFAHSIQTEPLRVSQLVRIQILEVGLQAIAEGLAAHGWDNEELAELQGTLNQIDYLADYERVTKSELALAAAWIDDVERQPEKISSQDGDHLDPWLWLALRCAPSGWYYQNKVAAGSWFERRILPLIDDQAKRAYPAQSQSNAIAFAHLEQTPITFVLKGVSVPFAAGRFARGQTDIDLAKIACALERYRLAQGQLPDSLEALAPRFITNLPHDIINGQPLKYRRVADGQFMLYSVGWDEKDDGGAARTVKPAADGSSGRGWGSDEAEVGDWVWRGS